MNTKMSLTIAICTSVLCALLLHNVQASPTLWNKDEPEIQSNALQVELREEDTGEGNAWAESTSPEETETPTTEPEDPETDTSSTDEDTSPTEEDTSAGGSSEDTTTAQSTNTAQPTTVGPNGNGASATVVSLSLLILTALIPTFKCL